MIRIALGLGAALLTYPAAYFAVTYISELGTGTNGMLTRSAHLIKFFLPAVICYGLVRSTLVSKSQKETALGAAVGLVIIAAMGAIEEYSRLKPALDNERLNAADYLDPFSAIGAALSVIAALAFYLFSRNRPKETKTGRIEPQRSASAVYGDADWMDMEKAISVLPSSRGIVLGECYRVDQDTVADVPFVPKDKSTWGQGGKGRLLCFDGQFGSTHGLVFAGSGGFKTTGIVIPTALSWPGSTVVLDPSSEVAPMVMREREAQGRDVFTLDPKNPELGFNVLDWISDSTRPEEHLASTATWLLNETQNKTDTGSFFTSNTHKLLTGILAHIMLDGIVPPARQNLRYMREIIAQPETKLQDKLRQIHEQSPNVFVRETLAAFVTMAQQTFTGVVATAATETQWLSYPSYAPLVCGNHFTTTELRNGQCDVFINLDLKTLDDYPGIARVIIGALMNSVYEADASIEGRCLFMLDEAARLGFMKIVKTARDAGRKYGITLLMVYQSIGQLKEIWGRNAQSDWFESTSFRSFAALSDPETAELVSKMCGEYTVSIRNMDKTRGFSAKSTDIIGTSSSNNQAREQTQKRRLILPHELLQDMRTDEQVILTAGNPPLRCGRPIYFRREKMLQAVDANRFEG